MPVYVTELADIAQAATGPRIFAPQMPPVAEQQRTVSGASAQTAAFNGGTRFVMVHTTEVVCLAFGADPTAVATAHRMAVGETRFYGVRPGDKLAAITGT
jgi:hypothetical protein